ncbi:MAG: AAA family ATPase, partial [Gammaproteobacteria bacterium]
MQGIAGSGKTTMIRSLNKLCKDSGFEIIGLTPTTGARERLQEGSQNLSSQDLLLRAGIKPVTVRKFLIESEKLLNLDPTLAKLEYGTNKLLILDEASFVSTAEMFAILSKLEQLDTRLVVMGDHRQLSSIEAGKIFYLMLGSEMQSVFITEN